MVENIDFNENYIDLFKDRTIYNLNPKVKIGADFKLLTNTDLGSLYYSSLLNKIFLIDSKKKLDKLKKRKYSLPDSCSLKNQTYIILFPTTRCNFNCVYCLSDAKKEGLDMSFQLAKQGVDFFIKSRNLNRISVKFIGGGEPTQNFSLIKKVVNYLNNKKIKTNFGLQTNGFLSNKQKEWIDENMNGICISCDGPPDIQNKQRPLFNGKSSSVKVEEVINFFSDKKINLSVRSTISLATQSRQREIVDYFYKLRVKKIDFLNVLQIGRGIAQNDKSNKTPTKKEFVNNFLEARKYAEERGVDLNSNLFPLYKKTNIFCSCSFPNFMLTPDGYVSSCEDFSMGKENLKSPMIYGKFKKNRERFIFNEEKIKKLQKRKVENIEKCQDCFLKWNCAGGCQSMAFRNNNDIFRPFNRDCEWMKTITKKYLIWKAKEKWSFKETF